MAWAMQESEWANLAEEFRGTRGYASYREWPKQSTEELGAVSALLGTLEAQGILRGREIRSRTTGEDPPDCEFIDQSGRRIAVEVTELVDPNHIQLIKSQRTDLSAQWDRLTGAQWHASKLVARIADGTPARL